MAEVEGKPSLLQEDKGQDEAMAAFEGLNKVIEVDEAPDRRLLRKIDLILLPVNHLSVRILL